MHCTGGSGLNPHILGNTHFNLHKANHKLQIKGLISLTYHIRLMNYQCYLLIPRKGPYDGWSALRGTLSTMALSYTIIGGITSQPRTLWSSMLKPVNQRVRGIHWGCGGKLVQDATGYCAAIMLGIMYFGKLRWGRVLELGNCVTRMSVTYGPMESSRIEQLTLKQ